MPLYKGKKNIGRCDVTGCGNTNIMARGLCNAHYKKWWRHGDASFIYARPKKGKTISKCVNCNETRTIEAIKLCKSCYMKQWEAKRPSRRPQRLMKQYGLTMEQYDEMLLKQGGVCAICKERSDKNLHIDHNHETGEIRGLLCYRCNSAIGYLSDNPDRARELADYLEQNYATNKGFVSQNN